MQAPPTTRRSDHVDELHGEVVADPYRWLEDTDDPETRAFIATQNELTETFLAGVGARPAIRRRLAELWDNPRVGVPFERGGRWFQRRNSGLQNQSVLYVLDGPDDAARHGAGRVLLDPNALSQDGTVAVPALSVSDDGSLLLYATSTAGSDWMSWHVREVASGNDLPDVVEWSKFGAGSWLADASGFFYPAMEPPAPGSEYLGQTSAPRVALHRLGTLQAEDEVVVAYPEEPEWLPYAEVTEDGRYVVVSVSKGTAPEQRIEVIELDAGGWNRVAIVPEMTARASVAANVGSTFYVLTDDSAERRRIVAIELERPGREHWREVVAESDALLLDARNCGGTLVCHHLENACSRLSVVSFEGEHLHEVALPAVASLGGEDAGAFVEGRPESTLVHFGLVSFVDPGSLWSHDVATGETRRLRASEAPIDPASFVSEQVFVSADDGVSIPLFLTRRAGVEPDGEVPVLLYGYGGFDVPMTPRFSRAFATFAERGGLVAVAALRGGGEFGRSWHDAGRLANKQRVFDDFCDCARWLHSSGWSRPERIAINGGSNGGLLVGACLTQHPELFGAAVPEVGVLDMLRFHRFTIGWAWKSDYGDPEDSEQFEWLRAYSPLQNIRTGVVYPATLVMTGDHDDRVVPGHSFKFAAALQAAQAETARSKGIEVPPILIRVETSAGHGLGKPVSKAIDERADMLAFLDGVLATNR